MVTRFKTPDDKGKTIFSIIVNANGDWLYDFDLAGTNDLQKTNLAVALHDILVEIKEIIDVESAEGQIRRELKRRLSGLASSAMAAGKLSDMWSNMNSRFYKQRKILTDQIK